jgi:AcrR family transcriptional regulator
VVSAQSAGRPKADKTAKALPGKAIHILAAGEVVFAQKGFAGATMREVAETAGVGLSLLVYHFRTKDLLYRAIFQARQYVNDERLERLRNITDPTAPDAVDRIVAAFIDPVLALHSDPTQVWFARLVLREAADPSSQERTIIKDLFDPMAQGFIAKLEQALPGRPAGFHAWAYLFSVGALTQSAFDARFSNIAGPANHLESKSEFLRRYITAGLQQA